MAFVLGPLRQLGTVAVVMLCATGGTVGLIKLIQRFTPGGLPKDPLSERLEESKKREE